MRTHPWLPLLAWIAGCMGAAAQSGRGEPQAGYLHPAGGCRGTTFEMVAAGQNIRNVKEVRVSGTGVRARVIDTYRAQRNIPPDQRAVMRWQIACRRAQLNGKPPPEKPAQPPNPDGTPAPEVQAPKILLLGLLEKLDLRGIEHWLTVFERHDRAQPSPQLGDQVRIEVSIAPDAEPGMRELRLGGPHGLSNPMRFEIGVLPEIQECEPNEPQSDAKPGDAAPPQTPCTFNGQIQSGDVDAFRFRARRGENLVVRGRARALIPYLADAVPGWFQMVVSVRDAMGREVAYGDDFRFDPDPVLCFRVPEDGEYTLEIRDSIYRGREDFVYRVHVGELPFLASVFPLGGREGAPLNVELRGWNLPASHMTLDTSPGGPPLRMVSIPGKHGVSNEVPYIVDTLPETPDTEPNQDAANAQPVPFPTVINGRIGKPGDADVFRIDGRKGMELVVEALARRLRSPLDAVVHVADDSGRVLAWSDDLMEKDGHLHLGDGLLTHHADSRVRVRIPADGPVFIRIADTQTHGGSEYAYRLRICGVRPDFELRVSPSAVNAMAGGNEPLRVHVLRNDGFNGEIRLALQDAPPGFTLSGARIPAGASQARITLAVPPGSKGGVLAPHLTGTAVHNGENVTRTAIAADDIMQAFLWRHLVPSREWLVCVAEGRGKRTVLDVGSELPLRVPAGGSAVLKINAPKWVAERNPEPELNEAPQGIGISPARPVPGGIALDVRADADLKAGTQTNLIIDLYATAAAGGKPAKAAKAGQRFMFSTLPAIPILIVPPATP
jgi:hypothetical protein